MTYHEVDVLIVGSGAGGLAAALATAEAHGNALVVEKSDEFGGTSATSGGGIWVPNSDQARTAGLVDSEEEAFDYVRALSLPNVPDALIRAYIRKAPEMLRWLEATSSVRYASMPYPDYHAENPGGKQGYRTHLPLPLDGRALGNDILNLRSASPTASLFGTINWRLEETYALLFRSKGWLRTFWRMVWRYASDIPHRFRSRKDRTLTNGNALVGGLYMALKARGVPIWLSTRLVELVEENGRVTGAIVSRDDVMMRIRARRGVILAAGGFERNAHMRQTYLPGSPDPTMSGSQINNTGDAIVAAERVGAALRNMHSSWTAPVFRVPGEDRARPSWVERALPGSIIVDASGKRYMNEAASYHVVGQKMLDHGAAFAPSWFLFDATYRRKYPAGPLLPLIPDFFQIPRLGGIVKKARSIDALAAKIGVSAEILRSTITQFNSGARIGKDNEFDRGGLVYDRMYGDQRVAPNPTLAPIERAPFYALPIFAGDIGTNGGIVTDEEGHVLNRDGNRIEGLYATGNNAASAMGASYPGAGVTLGPALTFGYVAAREAMGVNV